MKYKMLFKNIDRQLFVSSCKQFNSLDGDE